MIIGGAVLATAAFWFVGDGGRRLRRNWTGWDWVGFVVLGVCALSVLSVIASHRWGIWQISTQYHKGAMIKDAFWAAGSLTIGLGVLPTIAGLASIAKPRHGPWPREQRAFAAIAGSMFVGFVVYSAVKAAFVATLGLNDLIERNLIYVAPLLFVGTALVLEQRRARTSALVAATAFALYVVVATPYHIDIPVFFDAPGLAILPGLDRAVGLSDAGATVAARRARARLCGGARCSFARRAARPVRSSPQPPPDSSSRGTCTARSASRGRRTRRPTGT